jgi:hypothetical protein
LSIASEHVEGREQSFEDIKDIVVFVEAMQEVSALS